MSRLFRAGRSLIIPRFTINIVINVKPDKASRCGAPPGSSFTVGKFFCLSRDTTPRLNATKIVKMVERLQGVNCCRRQRRLDRVYQTLHNVAQVSVKLSRWSSKTEERYLSTVIASFVEYSAVYECSRAYFRFATFQVVPACATSRKSIAERNRDQARVLS